MQQEEALVKLFVLTTPCALDLETSERVSAAHDTRHDHTNLLNQAARSQAH